MKDFVREYIKKMKEVHTVAEQARPNWFERRTITNNNTEFFNVYNLRQLQYISAFQSILIL